MIVLLVSLFFQSVVATAKPYKVAKHKFHIDVPEGWDIAPKDEEADPIKLALTSVDKTANVTVMVVPITRRESAASLLEATDARRKMANELAKEQSKLSKKQLAKIGADDGAIGRYTKAEVLQRAFVVTKGRYAYVVIGAFRKSKEHELSKVIDLSLKSFTLID